MAIDRRTLEGIEACRPGSGDLQSPELSDVARRIESDPEAQAAYRRVQAWDAAIAGAMEQVPLPSGLAERILDRLNAAQSAAAQPPETQPAEVESAASADAAGAALAAAADRVDAGSTAQPLSRAALRIAGHWSRRRWLAGGASIAAAIVLAVFISRQWRPAAETPLETMADEWLAGLGSGWHLMSEAPQGFEIPSAIMAEPAGWQRVAQVAGGRGVAYKLVHNNAGTARLFVVRLAAAGLPASPPASPQSSTGGKTIGYWRSGAYVYVLVVEGNERSYRAFVNSSRMPLA